MIRIPLVLLRNPKSCLGSVTSRRALKVHRARRPVSGDQNLLGFASSACRRRWSKIAFFLVVPVVVLASQGCAAASHHLRSRYHFLQDPSWSNRRRSTQVCRSLFLLHRGLALRTAFSLAMEAAVHSVFVDLCDGVSIREPLLSVSPPTGVSELGSVWCLLCRVVWSSFDFWKFMSLLASSA
ncbi:unnamed protein product [Arabidopsis lyrata]|nr:unnamed protein product [Arabidopsis lyrata]